MWNWGKQHSRLGGTILSALDIGSSKVSCIIARLKGAANVEVLGIGQQLSAGLKAGVVVDMEEVITSIVNAVHTAEKMAGITIRNVLLIVNGAHLKSANYSVEMNVSGHPVDDADIRRALLKAKSMHDGSVYQSLHTEPTSYSLDGTKGIKDPRGMYGERLLISIYTLMSKSSPLYNLNTCVARSHLEVSGLVAAPYASALACLVEDEMELGSVLIDMGGSTTSFAIFQEGQLRHIESLPIGGSHVTTDIARGFSTTLVNAERLKTLYGSAIYAAADDKEMISVPLVGEKPGSLMNQVPRSALVSIIKPRIEETFELILSRLKKAGANPFDGRRIVVTGGASQLAGIREVAALTLGKNVRLGRPLLGDSHEPLQDPALAGCVGLLVYGQAEHFAYLQSFPETRSKRAFNQIKSVLKQIW